MNTCIASALHADDMQQPIVKKIIIEKDAEKM